MPRADLTDDEWKNWDELRRGIGASTQTAAIRAIGLLFAESERFRSETLDAAGAWGVDKDGRLPK